VVSSKAIRVVAATDCDLAPDEMDARLDESNILRFTRRLKEMSDTPS
jgi:hypothetical protein